MKKTPSLDLFDLALAPMPARIVALGHVWAREEEPGSLPSKAVQIAGLIVGETVRLIRRGTHSEVAEAGLELSRLLARPATERAVAIHPESHRLASGSSVVLTAAAAPSSGGSELTVLDSWNGKAKEAVELLNRAHGEALGRSELGAALGDIGGSHLTRLLTDLESAGLVLRIKEGKTVTVHLGPNAKSDHVQRTLSKRPPNVRFRGTEREPRHVHHRHLIPSGWKEVKLQRATREQDPLQFKSSEEPIHLMKRHQIVSYPGGISDVLSAAENHSVLYFQAPVEPTREVEKEAETELAPLGLSDGRR